MASVNSGIYHVKSLPEIKTFLGKGKDMSFYLRDDRFYIEIFGKIFYIKASCNLTILSKQVPENSQGEVFRRSIASLLAMCVQNREVIPESMMLFVDILKQFYCEEISKSEIKTIEMMAIFLNMLILFKHFRTLLSKQTIVSVAA